MIPRFTQIMEECGTKEWVARIFLPRDAGLLMDYPPFLDEWRGLPWGYIPADGLRGVRISPAEMEMLMAFAVNFAKGNIRMPGVSATLGRFQIDPMIYDY